MLATPAFLPSESLNQSWRGLCLSSLRLEVKACVSLSRWQRLEFELSSWKSSWDGLEESPDTLKYPPWQVWKRRGRKVRRGGWTFASVAWWLPRRDNPEWGEVSRTAPPLVAFGVDWRCQRRRGSYPNARYQTYQIPLEKEKRACWGGWRGREGSKRKSKRNGSFKASARDNSINNRGRLVNTAVITPNIKQPRWHLAHRRGGLLSGRGSRVPGSSASPLCLSQPNLPQWAVPQPGRCLS